MSNISIKPEQMLGESNCLEEIDICCVKKKENLKGGEFVAKILSSDRSTVLKEPFILWWLIDSEK